jgi:hypothetical protein
MIAASLAATPLQAQEALPLLSADVAVSDFGVADASALVWGRVSVVYALEGPRLAVHYLREVPPPALPSPPAEGPGLIDERPPRLPGSEQHTGLWVWNTAELLGDGVERRAFLDLVAEEGIDRVFLYLPASSGRAPSAGFVPFDGASLGPLVAELRARGALTYGLDGDPDYARPENHAGVLRTVARLVEHNRAAPPDQRFHGVRLDVEPYLLPGFQGPGRQQLLSDYLSLIESVSVAAREGGLAVGVDIPSWLDGPDEVTGARFEALLAGSRGPVLDHLLGLVDDVGLMAYRTFSDGPDGVLAHASGELSGAQGAGVDVFVGVETTRIFDEELHTFRGAGRRGLPTLKDAAWIVALDLGGGRSRIWLVRGAEAWDALEEAAGDDAGSLTYWFAGSPVPLPGERVSFHSLGLDAMRRVSGEVRRGLAGRAAFRGLAYHDYVGLKALVEGR